MYLKSLEIQGFKSFPDKTVLDFNKGMTAVVGPNGSGKSNISDAIRWVLGEQSSKSLRSSKMEDVIFSGTSVRRPKGFAEVTLKLDNSDKSLGFDESLVSVTRRYYRSGESEYLINSKPVRLRDVHEIFMDTGLGRDGYSMVSQGRIEDIVSAKSQDRREMFEEAAGISHYRYRRADALRKLEQSEDNLSRLRDILSELEDRVEPLRIQSEKAEKFLNYAGEKKQLEIGIWLHNFEKSSMTLREQENKILAASMHYDELDADLKNIYEQTELTSNEIRQIIIEIDNIQKAVSGLEEEAANAEALIAVDKNSIEHNNINIERYKKEKEEEERIDKHLEGRIDEVNLKIDELEDEIRKKQDELRLAIKSLDELKLSDSIHSEEMDKLLKEQSQNLYSLSELKISQTSHRAAIEEITARNQSLETSIEGKNDELEKIRQRQKALETKNDEHLAEITSLNNEIKAYEIKLRLRAEKEESLKNQRDSLKIKTEQKESRIKLLDEMEKNMEGYTGSVKTLVLESKRGRLKGIRGAVSQLISAKDEFACAIETALGAAIQNIITDNENDAKNAMNFLRVQNAGRATFLPLSTIKAKALNERGLENCQGYVDIASNLVKTDNTYAEIIKFLLGRTIVADDIDSAIAISKKYSHRLRIVTLDGQLINAGGSMTGGSRIKSGGFLSRSNEIFGLNQEVLSLKEDLKKLSDMHKEAEEDKSRQIALIEGAKSKLFNVQEEQIHTKSGINIALSQIKDAENQIGELLTEKGEAKKRIESLSVLINEGEKEIGVLDALREDIQNRAKSLGEGKNILAEQKEELDRQTTEAEINIASITKEIEAQKEAKVSLLRRKDSHGQRFKEINDMVEEIMQNNISLNQKISESESLAQTKHEESKILRQKIEDFIIKRDEYEKHLRDMRQNERAKAEEHSKMAGEKVRLQERQEALKKAQEDIERRLYEEYQITRREAEEMNIEIPVISGAEKRLAELKALIRRLGNINLSAIEEYKEVYERYHFLKEQIEDTEKSKKALEKLIKELTEKMAIQFKEKFLEINKNFKEYFTKLFSGGDADLVLEDEENVLECGIEIKAQPPGKNVKSISLLSGGEKGLCAIALLFAMLKLSPAPFCVYDEVEAALDDINVLRYASFVKNMSKATQFILITHRRGTMEEADMLYGVTMQEEGVSKLLELKTAEMAKDLGLEE